MTTIAIANQKGGCGKTTTAINLAACLGKSGHHVLLIDMDPQGHASMGLGIQQEDMLGLYEVLMHDADLEDVILPGVIEGVDLIPATISLAAVEHLLADIPKRERQLVMQLEHLPKSYDLIIIDCPPGLGLLSINALRAASQVLIPIEMSIFSLDGIDRLSETVNLIEEKYDLEIPIRILPTLVDYRTRFTNVIIKELRERFSDEILPMHIHYTVRLKEAAYRGIPLIDYAPLSPASLDYMRLAEKILHDAGLSKTVALPEPQQEPAPLPIRPQEVPVLQKAPLPVTDNPLPDADKIELNKPNGNLYSSAIYEEAKEKMTLSFRNIDSNEVQIAGDFNNWVPDHGVETRVINGIVQKVLNIKPGAYQYRLILDGKWQEDPSNPYQITNEYGEVNSLLQVQHNH